MPSLSRSSSFNIVKQAQLRKRIMKPPRQLEHFMDPDRRGWLDWGAQKRYFYSIFCPPLAWVKPDFGILPCTGGPRCPMWIYSSSSLVTTVAKSQCIVLVEDFGFTPLARILNVVAAGGIFSSDSSFNPSACVRSRRTENFPHRIIAKVEPKGHAGA